MIDIEKMCKNLTDKIADELSLDIQRRAVVNYGLFAIIQTVLSILITILLGALFGVLIPALILSLSSVILRKYSGGAHAKTPESCALIGVFISVGGALILSSIKWKAISVLLGGIGVFVFAFYWVYQLAPVDSPAKPIKNIEKQQLLKKKSILVVSVYLVIVSVLIGSSFISHHDELLLFTVCLYSGILWQIFTLTKKGHLLIDKIDIFLIHTILRNRGEMKNEKN